MVHSTTPKSIAGEQYNDYTDEMEYIAKQLGVFENIRTQREIEDITIKVRIWC